MTTSLIRRGRARRTIAVTTTAPSAKIARNVSNVTSGRIVRTPQRERSERPSVPNARSRSRRYARDDRNGEEAGNRQSESAGESIAFEALPPAIGRVDSDDQPEPEVEAAKPRRRTGARAPTKLTAISLPLLKGAYRT